MKTNKFAIAALSALCLSCIAPANAASAYPVYISGSGLWGPNTDSNPGYSAPNATWNFSFQLDSVPTSDGVEYSARNFVYSLGNTSFTNNLATVYFLPDDPGSDHYYEHGMFDLYLHDATTDEGAPNSFHLTGIDLLSSGHFAFSDPPASPFAVTIDFNNLTFEGVSQVGTGTVNVSTVPEPVTYAQLVAGLGLVGFAIRRKKLYQSV